MKSNIVLLVIRILVKKHELLDKVDERSFFENINIPLYLFLFVCKERNVRETSKG